MTLPPIAWNTQLIDPETGLPTQFFLTYLSILAQIIKELQTP